MTKEKLSCTIDLKSGFTHILFNLAAQGYSHIRVQYSGGGDSGAIDSIIAYPTGSVMVDEDTQKVIDYDEDRSVADLDEELFKVIENSIYVQILNSADDWYNNDGGGGTLWVDLRDASYLGDHYVNVTETIDTVLEGKLGDGTSTRS